MTSEGQYAGSQPAETTSGGPAPDGFPPDSEGRRASGRASAPPPADGFPNSYGPPPQATPNGGSPFVVPAVPTFGQGPDAPGGRPATGTSYGSARVPQTDDSGSLPQRAASPYGTVSPEPTFASSSDPLPQRNPSPTNPGGSIEGFDGFAAGTPGRGTAGRDDADPPTGRPPGVSPFGDQQVRVPGATLTGLPDAPAPRPAEDPTGFPLRGGGNGTFPIRRGGDSGGFPLRGSEGGSDSDGSGLPVRGEGGGLPVRGETPAVAGSDLPVRGQQAPYAPPAADSFSAFGNPPADDIPPHPYGGPGGGAQPPSASPERGSLPDGFGRAPDAPPASGPAAFGAARPASPDSSRPAEFGAAAPGRQPFGPRPGEAPAPFGPNGNASSSEAPFGRPASPDAPFGTAGNTQPGGPFGAPPSGPFGAAPADSPFGRSGDAPSDGPFGQGAAQASDGPFGDRAVGRGSAQVGDSGGNPFGRPGNAPASDAPADHGPPGGDFGRPGNASFGVAGRASVGDGPFGRGNDPSGDGPFGPAGNAPSTDGPFGRAGTAPASDAPSGAGPFGRDNTAPPADAPFGRASAAPSSDAPFGVAGNAPTGDGPFGRVDNAPPSGGPFGRAADPAPGDGPFGPAQGEDPFGRAGHAPSSDAPFGAAGNAPAGDGPFGQAGNAGQSDGPFARSGNPPQSDGPFGRAGNAAQDDGPFGRSGNARQDDGPFGRASNSAAGDSAFGHPGNAGQDDGPFAGGDNSAPSDRPFGRAGNAAAHSDGPFGHPGNPGQGDDPFGRSNNAAPTAGPFGNPAQAENPFGRPGNAPSSDAPFGRPADGPFGAAADSPFGAQPQAGGPGSPAAPDEHSLYRRPDAPAGDGNPYPQRVPGASLGSGGAAPGESRNGSVPQPRDPAEPPAVGSARPVTASASVPSASRAPVEPNELPPPAAAAAQARVYGRPAPAETDDDAAGEEAGSRPAAFPFPSRTGEEAHGSPAYPQRPGDHDGAGGDSPLSGLAPQSPARATARASASARVAPPSAQPSGGPTPGATPFGGGAAGAAQPGATPFGGAAQPDGHRPPHAEFTNRPGAAPEHYSEHTTDIAGRPDSPYVPAPALPAMPPGIGGGGGFPPPPNDDTRMGGVFPGPTNRPSVTPPGPQDTTSWPGPGSNSDQSKFDHFTQQTDAPAAKPETPHVRMLPILLAVVVGAVLLLGVVFGIVWLVAGGGDEDNALSVATGECVKRDGDAAVKSDCSDATSFEVVSIVDDKGQCADPQQPYVVNPTSDGKSQVLCLKPRG